jgi:two-component system response regulator AtoC
MESILIVDDNADLRMTLSDTLREEGFDTFAVEDGKAAIKKIKKVRPDLALLDIKLPGMDGVELLEEMKRIDKNLIIIMLTAYGDIKDAVKALKLGAFDYITKPFDNEELIIVIRKALQSHYLSREVEILRTRLGEKTALEQTIGRSSVIMHVIRQVKIVAPTTMTVLVQGESGTGKELLAQMIHENSPRRDRPFIAVACGAIPETLVESELFGHERGAFTGADSQKEGKFEQAQGGSLFLDEIANFSENVQVKLLRALQERRIQHIGEKGVSMLM